VKKNPKPKKPNQEAPQTPSTSPPQTNFPTWTKEKVTVAAAFYLWDWIALFCRTKVLLICQWEKALSVVFCQLWRTRVTKIIPWYIIQWRGAFSFSVSCYPHLFLRTILSSSAINVLAIWGVFLDLLYSLTSHLCDIIVISLLIFFSVKKRNSSEQEFNLFG